MGTRDFFYITAKYVEHFKPHSKGLLIPAVGQVAEHADHRRAQQREAQRRNLARRDSCWTAWRRGELPGGRDWLCCCGQGGRLGCWCLQANPQVLLADSPAYTG